MPIDREEVRWFNETEGKTFEQLSDSGDERFHHLDALLAESLVKILPQRAIGESAAERIGGAQKQ